MTKHTFLIFGSIVILVGLFLFYFLAGKIYSKLISMTFSEWIYWFKKLLISGIMIIWIILATALIVHMQFNN